MTEWVWLEGAGDIHLAAEVHNHGGLCEEFGSCVSQYHSAK